LAIFFWSIATSAAGLANDLVALVLLRSLIGVGQAAFSTISPPMLTDFYPVRDRNVMFGIFYLAIPVGGAVGYGVGAVLGELYGWRIAFLAMGVPGLILSFLVPSLNNPMKGINDVNLLQVGIDASNDSSINSAVSPLRSLELLATMKQNYSEIMEIISNKYFVIATAGLSVSDFAISGLAEWYATYLHRYDDLSIAYSGLLAGGNLQLYNLININFL
jgi:MFS family permease